MLTQNRTMSHKEYECKFCNYNTSRMNDYNKHLLTRKHIMLSNADDNADIKKENMIVVYVIQQKEQTYVLTVNILKVLKDIYPQKIHMKSYVLIVTIIYIQMKKKYQLNIRKNNILFTKNLKKDMVKIISNMT